MIMEFKLCHIKNLIVNSMMFPHRNIHKFTWGRFPDGKTHSQIDHILIDRLHSTVLNVRGFMTADCDNDHYLAVGKVRETSLSKQTAHCS
jgi:hypothetical protein